LVDAGEFNTIERSRYCPTAGGIRVDGYAGDPGENEGELCLIILDYNQSEDISTLNQTEMNSIFKRLENFLNKSRDIRFRNSLDEVDPAFGLSDLISTRWAHISKIRLFLVSNRQLSAKIDGRVAGEIDGKPVSYSVWDLERLYRFEISGSGREELFIDLDADYGGPIPLLPAHIGDTDYEAYLAVISGDKLASIYDRWGARLLERNVRVFLQAKGSVNKGIRNTLNNDPEMFFAYNNGITATAEGINTRKLDGALFLTSLKNLQIVNGGQTTASIHAASRRNVDLSKVYVQMKLSIVRPENANEIVQLISEYANTQNRVNAADFFANHPFHLRFEEFSRRIYAPSRDGVFRETKWYYERARGQYQDERGLLAVSQQKKFDLEFPKSQLISKTDLAKYLNVWNGFPDIVSKGAQANFINFASKIGNDWKKQSDSFNEDAYREAIAKAIIFKATEKIITEQDWYSGGYRANIVAYALAKMGFDCETRKKLVDFLSIWKMQSISNDMEHALAVASKAAYDVLITPPVGMTNVTQWAKQQACWSRVKAVNVDWPQSWLSQLVDTDQVSEGKRFSVKDQKLLNGIEAQSLVVSIGGSFWKELSSWGHTRKLLSPNDMGCLSIACSLPNKIPTEKQSIRIIDIFRRLRLEGCPIGKDIKL
jgi:hypothetical protein